MKFVLDGNTWFMMSPEDAIECGYKPVGQLPSGYVLFRKDNGDEVACYWPDCDIYLPRV